MEWRYDKIIGRFKSAGDKKEELKLNSVKNVLNRLRQRQSEATLALGGEDGQTFTPEQIEEYFASSLLVSQFHDQRVSLGPAASTDLTKKLGKAQDLTTKDGRNAAVSCVISNINFLARHVQSPVLSPEDRTQMIRTRYVLDNLVTHLRS